MLTPEPLTIFDAIQLAVQHQDAGRLEEAERLLWRILESHPDEPDPWNLIGVIARQIGRHDIALVMIRRAIELRPDFAHYRLTLGMVLLDLKRWSDALATLSKAVQLEPRNADAWNNGGSAFRGLERSNDAIMAYRSAIAIDPNKAAAHSNLSTAYRHIGDTDNAIASAFRAVDLKPDWADAHWNLSLALLTAGRWREGWQAYEQRWGVSIFNSPRLPFKCPQWKGESLYRKTICVWGEQGAGDVIMMGRYLRVLEERGATVLTCFSEAVAPLFDYGTTDASDPTLDFHVPVMSLPLALSHEKPWWIGEYIHAGRAIPAGEVVHVGVCWAGAPGHTNDRNRSLPAEAFEALRCEGAMFHSLQKGQGRAPKWMTDDMPVCETFADTAALIANIDLVICVDTAVAHLAGAMGKPVWVILPEAGVDWRWGTAGDKTPWYPSMTLLRKDGVARAAGMLRERVAKCEPVLSH